WTCAGILMAAAAYAIYWIVPLPDLMSERRVYLPYVGVAIVVCGLSALFARPELGMSKGRGRSAAANHTVDSHHTPASAWVPLLVVTLLLAPALHARSRLWSDPRRVWEEAAFLAPKQVRPYIDLGVMAAVRGDRQGAAESFDKAVALEPANPEAL